MKKILKNKKGFTLVEVIVVLVIMGILLAITVPSILGYVGQAKDAQYMAEGRNGYFAAQTILAKEVAGKASITAADKTEILKEINNPNNIAKELGETDGSSAGITQSIVCELTTAGTSISGCSIQTTGTGTGTGKKWVNFVAGTSTASPNVTVSTTATYPTK